MVWVSAFILIFSLFPEILARVKKIKVKDFELEFQDVVETAKSASAIFPINYDSQIFTAKGKVENLIKIAELIFKFPRRSVLLTVNLRNDRIISIPALFGYLHLLELIGAPVTVLFLKSRRRIRKISEIEKSHVIGAIAGQRVKRTFFLRYPWLPQIFALPGDNGEYFDPEQEQGLYQLGFAQLRQYVYRLSDNLQRGINNRRHFLRVNDVKEWFAGELSTLFIEIDKSPDVSQVRKAIVSEDEFILLVVAGKLDSVIPVCALTKDIALRRVLQYQSAEAE